MLEVIEIVILIIIIFPIVWMICEGTFHEDKVEKINTKIDKLVEMREQPEKSVYVLRFEEQNTIKIPKNKTEIVYVEDLNDVCLEICNITTNYIHKKWFREKEVWYMKDARYTLYITKDF